MRYLRLVGGWVAAVGMAAGVPWGLQALGRDAAPQVQTPQIPSLSEPGEGLAIRDRSTQTGLVTFAAAEGRGILVSVQANAPTETRARSFMGLYGAEFGIGDQAQLRLA